MAASEHEKGHVPAVLGGDLPEKEQTALEDSHDADVSTNENQTTENSLGKEVSPEHEKVEKRDVSSNSSEDGSPQDRDVEKGRPEVHESEPLEKPRDAADPNVVDWEGPDEPENPLNWYVAYNDAVILSGTALFGRSVLMVFQGRPARSGATSPFSPF